MLEIIFVFLLIDCTYAIADCGTPDYMLDVDQSCINIGSVTPPATTTEGASVTFSCATLLIRTRAPWDYCPVKVCQDTGQWSGAKLSCGGATECFDASGDYEGRRTCTVSGKTCQSWSSQSTIKHNYTDSSFPSNNMSKAGIYCRDPDGERGEPWCLTADSGPDGELCGVQDCAAITTDQGTCPDNYCGDPDNMVSTDNTCLISSATSDGTRNVGSYIAYYCLGLLTGFTSLIDYCPVKVCQSDSYWSTNKISCGANECYVPSQSKLYQGRRTCTQTGRPCEPWTSQSNYTIDSDFSDGSVSAAGSYCRDPGGDKSEPWCYFNTTSEEYDTCGVPSCPSLPMNYGYCDPPVTTTTTTLSSTTTLGSTTASASASTSSSTTSPAVIADYQRYQRVNSDRTGFRKQFTIPFVENSIACARTCSEQMPCVLIIYKTSDGTCSLYEEDTSDFTNISCTTVKCYIHDNLL